MRRGLLTSGCTRKQREARIWPNCKSPLPLTDFLWIGSNLKIYINALDSTKQKDIIPSLWHGWECPDHECKCPHLVSRSVQMLYGDTLISARITDGECPNLPHRSSQGMPSLMHMSSTGCSYFMPVIWIWQKVCGKERANFKKNRDFESGFPERKGCCYNWIIGSGVPLKSKV